MHGRKKSDLPQTKEEKDAVEAKISKYKKASGTFTKKCCLSACRQDAAAPVQSYRLSVLSLCISCVLDRILSLVNYSWRCSATTDHLSRVCPAVVVRELRRTNTSSHARWQAVGKSEVDRTLSKRRPSRGLLRVHNLLMA